LVANAINYTPRGGRVVCRVVTNKALDPPQVGFIVSDTGLGIDPEDRPHLFERFYRGQRVSQSNTPGTGLGLAIVKEIVELHKGKIELETEVDRGTTFYVWLPLDEG
jgi:two-component system phosphate regulon sensor histidine kinase PhoR